jgi:hypothetical protein
MIFTILQQSLLKKFFIFSEESSSSESSESASSNSNDYDSDESSESTSISCNDSEDDFESEAPQLNGSQIAQISMNELPAEIKLNLFVNNIPTTVSQMTPDEFQWKIFELSLDDINAPVFKYFLKNYSQKNTIDFLMTDMYQRNAFHHAIGNNNLKIVSLFIKYLPSCKFKDAFGFSPAHFALKAKDTDQNQLMIKLLLENNFNFFAIGFDGSSACSYIPKEPCTRLPSARIFNILEKKVQEWVISWSTKLEENQNVQNILKQKLRKKYG